MSGIYTREQIYWAEFRPCRDGKLLAQYPPHLRRKVPDYNWAMSEGYEDFIPPRMTKAEQDKRWTKTPEEIQRITQSVGRSDYTPWEIGEMWRRTKSGATIITSPLMHLPQVSPTQHGVHLDPVIIMQIMAEREQRIINVLREIIQQETRVNQAAIQRMRQRQAQQLKKVARLEAESDRMMIISRREYNAISPIKAQHPTDDPDYVFITRHTVLDILTNATIISPDTCNLMLELVDDFMPKRALWLIRAGMVPPVVRGHSTPWMRKMKNGSYASSPLRMTQQNITAYSAILFPNDVVRVPPGWKSGKITVECRAHGEFTVTANKYLAGARGPNCRPGCSGGLWAAGGRVSSQ